jgi:hypothetical protein
MNIFFLHTDAQKAAEMQCDKHIPKMAVESVQMLVSALRRHGATDNDVPLTKAGTPHRGGYANHPSTRWAGDTAGNFFWLADHGIALCREYTYRFGKEHACLAQLYDCHRAGWNFIPYGARTDVPLCVGEDMQRKYNKMTASMWDAVEVYRDFYHADKAEFAKWEKGRPAPSWWNAPALELVA